MNDSFDERLNPNLVDDLLRGLDDWQAVPDIVRLTLKALVEVVRTQGSAIYELERHSRAARVELHSSLAQKADYSEISQEVADLRSYFENRGSVGDLQATLNEKVSHEEFLGLLEEKVSVSQLEDLTAAFTHNRDFEACVQEFYARIERLQQVINQHAQLAPSYKDVSTLSNRIDKLVEFEHFEAGMHQLEDRVLDALNKRLLKVESTMSRKAEMTDHQRTLTLIASKADQSRVDDLNGLLNEKLDTSQFVEQYWPQVLAKAEKSEFHAAFTHIKDMRGDVKKVSEDAKRDLAMAVSGLKRDIETVHDQLALELSSKATVKEAEKLLELLQKKSDHHSLEELLKHQQESLVEQFTVRMDQLEELATKHKTEADQGFQGVREDLDLARTESQKLNEALHSVTQDHHAAKAHLQGTTEVTKQEILDQLTALQQNVERTLEQKAEASALQTLATDLADTAQETRAAVQELQASQQQALSDTSTALLQQLENVEKTLQAVVDTKVCALEERVAGKADAHQLDALVEASVASEDILCYRDDVERILQEAESFATKEELTEHVVRTKNALEDVAKDMLLKANVKDVCGVLDNKASIDEVNQALSEIHSELDAKASHQDFAEHLNEQGLINEALCSENTLGRWIWKGGETRYGHLVPWDIQAVNTCPDNFLWEAETTSIVVMTPGLYEIVFGFYSRKKPKVQLLVNGDPVLSAVNNASYVIHHSSGRLMTVTSHPSGNIAGLTLIDFLALPAKAKVSLTYAGESKVEGFLGFRKI